MEITKIAKKKRTNIQMIARQHVRESIFILPMDYLWAKNDFAIRVAFNRGPIYLQM